MADIKLPTAEALRNLTTNTPNLVTLNKLIDAQLKGNSCVLLFEDSLKKQELIALGYNLQKVNIGLEDYILVSWRDGSDGWQE